MKKSNIPHSTIKDVVSVEVLKAWYLNASGRMWMNASPSRAPTAKLTKNVASCRIRVVFNDSVASPTSEIKLTSTTLIRLPTIAVTELDTAAG